MERHAKSGAIAFIFSVLVSMGEDVDARPQRVLGDLPGTEECPADLDNSNDASIFNMKTHQFINECLEHIDLTEVGGLSQNDRQALDSCSTQQSATMWKDGMVNLRSMAGEGRICNAKLYRVKCDKTGTGNQMLPGKCASAEIWRAYAGGQNAFGAYWTAWDPRDMEDGHGTADQSYREKHAMCKSWNPTTNRIAKAQLTVDACGSLVFIGNGERLMNCSKTLQENYSYSVHLQVVMCHYPQSAILNLQTLRWSEEDSSMDSSLPRPQGASKPAWDSPESRKRRASGAAWLMSWMPSFEVLVWMLGCSLVLLIVGSQSIWNLGAIPTVRDRRYATAPPASEVHATEPPASEVLASARSHV